MRHLISGLMLMAAPALAAAQQPLPEDWDNEPLYDDWRLSRVMLGTVETKDGAYGGDVHDIIIGDTGLVHSVVVEWYLPEKMDRRFFEVKWRNLEFDPRLQDVDVKLTTAEIGAMEKSESPEFAGENEYEASNLIGMPVEMDDRAPYGEISDLLVSQHASDITAYIVESDGPGLVEYALPAKEDAIDYENGRLSLPYVVEDVESLDAFLYDRANRLDAD